MDKNTELRDAQYRGLRDMIQGFGEDRSFMLVATLRGGPEPEAIYGFAVGWPAGTVAFPSQLHLGAALLELAQDWRFNPSDFDSATRGLLRAMILTHLGVPTLDPKKMPKTPPSDAEMLRQRQELIDVGRGYSFLLKALRPTWLGVDCVYDMADGAEGPREVTPILKLPDAYR